MDSCGKAIAGIAGLLLIIGGGGAFKQVLIDSGVGQYISTLVSGMDINPILMAWGVAAFLRICLGSATVAAISTARSGHPIVGSTSQYQPGLDYAGYRCRILYLFSR